MPVPISRKFRRRLIFLLQITKSTSRMTSYFKIKFPKCNLFFIAFSKVRYKNEKFSKLWRHFKCPRVFHFWTKNLFLSSSPSFIKKSAILGLLYMGLIIFGPSNSQLRQFDKLAQNFIFYYGSNYDQKNCMYQIQTILF